jgi:hypothetical protein
VVDGVGRWWEVPHLSTLLSRGGLTRLSEELQLQVFLAQSGLGISESGSPIQSGSSEMIW